MGKPGNRLDNSAKQKGYSVPIARLTFTLVAEVIYCCRCIHCSQENWHFPASTTDGMDKRRSSTFPSILHRNGGGKRTYGTYGEGGSGKGESFWNVNKNIENKKKKEMGL